MSGAVIPFLRRQGISVRYADELVENMQLDPLRRIRSTLRDESGRPAVKLAKMTISGQIFYSRREKVKGSSNHPWSFGHATFWPWLCTDLLDAYL